MSIGIHYPRQQSYIEQIHDNDNANELPPTFIERINRCIGSCCPLLRPSSSNTERRHTTNSQIESPLYDSQWHPRSLPFDVATKKMLKNAKKAMTEHFVRFERDLLTFGDPFDTRSLAPYLAPWQIQKFMEDNDISSNSDSPLRFTLSEAAEQGPRRWMEDAHFFHETPDYILMGVFDGHNGESVATYASMWFAKRFYQFLDEEASNVHYAFEATVRSMHIEMESKVAIWDRDHPEKPIHAGSTVVCSFINKKTGHIYTATVGDSEANIYRKVDGVVKSIPLSCVRDWRHPKEAAWAAKKLGQPEIAHEWPKAKNPKILRYPRKGEGINISRAIGDFHLEISHKPKITMNKLKPGDKVILCCDGLKDFVNEIGIIHNLEKAKHTNTAKHLTEIALRKMDQGVKNNDNVTVLHLDVHV